MQFLHLLLSLSLSISLDKNCESLVQVEFRRHRLSEEITTNSHPNSNVRRTLSLQKNMLPMNAAVIKLHGLEEIIHSFHCKKLHYINYKHYMEYERHKDSLTSLERHRFFLNK